MRMASMSSRQPGMGNCTGRAGAGQGGGNGVGVVNNFFFYPRQCEADMSRKSVPHHEETGELETQRPGSYRLYI